MKSKEQKRIEATARQAKYDAMSDKDRYWYLVERGHGHCAEAEKIRARLGGGK